MRPTSTPSSVVLVEPNPVRESTVGNQVFSCCGFTKGVVSPTFASQWTSVPLLSALGRPFLG